MLNGHYHRKRNYQSAQHVGEEADGGVIYSIPKNLTNDIAVYVTDLQFVRKGQNLII